MTPTKEIPSPVVPKTDSIPVSPAKHTVRRKKDDTKKEKEDKSTSKGKKTKKPKEKKAGADSLIDTVSTKPESKDVQSELKNGLIDTATPPAPVR